MLSLRDLSSQGQKDCELPVVLYCSGATERSEGGYLSVQAEPLCDIFKSAGVRVWATLHLLASSPQIPTYDSISLLILRQ